MSNALTMSWNSTSSKSFTAAVNKVKHGDRPTFRNPWTLSSTTPVTVEAAQSNNAAPGPEGKYTWNSTDRASSIECDYHFPTGSDHQMIQVSLSPSKGLQISFDNVNWTGSKLEQIWMSTGTTLTFTATLYVRDAS